MEEIKTILLNVQETVIKLQNGQEEMKQDIQGIKQEQQEMKEDMAEIKGTVHRIDEAQNIVVKEIFSMQKRLARLEKQRVTV